MLTPPDVLDLVRQMPEAGRLLPIDIERCRSESQRILAILRSASAQQAFTILRTCVDLLYDATHEDEQTGKVLSPDVVRLAIWMANRESFATKDGEPRVRRALILAWNAVAPPHLRIRIGKNRRATAHAEDVRRAFYDIDQTGRQCRPLGGDDTTHVTPSQIARVCGYTLRSEPVIPQPA